MNTAVPRTAVDDAHIEMTIEALRSEDLEAPEWHAMQLTIAHMLTELLAFRAAYPPGEYIVDRAAINAKDYDASRSPSEPNMKRVLDLASDLLLVANSGRNGYADACARDAADMLLVLLDQAMAYRSRWSSCSTQCNSVAQERDDYKRGKEEGYARAARAELDLDRVNFRVGQLEAGLRTMTECDAVCRRCAAWGRRVLSAPKTGGTS